MSDLDAFADAVRGWIAVIRAAAGLAPPARIEALTAHLVHLYAAGLRLPASGPPPDRIDVDAWPEDWPGLGAPDAATPPLTTLLRGLTADLATGLAWHEAAPPQAAAWWRSSFDARWGTLAAAALPRLHLAVVASRASDGGAAAAADPPAPRRAFATPAGPLLQVEPAPPERRSTGRARVASAPTGVLGVRCAPASDGLRVEAVHPAGPAAGVLAPGDLLLRIDGTTLAGLHGATAQAALAGPIGAPRLVVVRTADAVETRTVIPVDPASLAAGPTRVHLLVLDSDAAGTLLAGLAAIGVEVGLSDDHEGLVELIAPPGAAGAVLDGLRDGQEQGFWEVLPAP